MRTLSLLLLIGILSLSVHGCARGPQVGSDEEAKASMDDTMSADTMSDANSSP